MTATRPDIGSGRSATGVFGFGKLKRRVVSSMPSGVKPIDVVIALLMREAGQPHRHRAIAWLAQEMGISTRTSSESLTRLRRLRLIRPDDLTLVARRMLDLLVDAGPMVFPIEVGPVAGGVPTATSAQPLLNRFAAAEGELGFVWPSAAGSMRGSAIEPLHRSVPSLALAHPALHQDLALVDGLRLEEPRIRREARDMLRARLMEGA